MKKHFLMIFFVLFIFTACSTETNEPCDWCGGTPSMAYNTSNGRTSYVCKSCSSCCMLCGEEKNIKRYIGTSNMTMFVCSDCEADLKQMQSEFQQMQEEW